MRSAGCEKGVDRTNHAIHVAVKIAARIDRRGIDEGKVLKALRKLLRNSASASFRRGWERSESHLSKPFRLDPDRIGSIVDSELAAFASA